jgi:hypothetical protein
LVFDSHRRNNPHQRPCRPCPRMTRIHANKTMENRLLYSSPFATIRAICGQNFRFTSLAPAHVALRAAFGRLPSQRPLACVPLPLNAPSALRECGRRCAPETWGISAICPYPGERSGRRMRSSAYRKPTSAAKPLRRIFTTSTATPAPSKSTAQPSPSAPPKAKQPSSFNPPPI